MRAPILVDAKPSAGWSLDFVHDLFACGRRFRVLNIVDKAATSNPSTAGSATSC